MHALGLQQVFAGLGSPSLHSPFFFLVTYPNCLLGNDYTLLNNSVGTATEKDYPVFSKNWPQAPYQVHQTFLSCRPLTHEWIVTGTEKGWR